jgi:hypothetical protein
MQCVFMVPSHMNFDYVAKAILELKTQCLQHKTYSTLTVSNIASLVNIIGSSNHNKGK